MSNKNEDFFSKKKDWSTVKDDLLGCYLEPYFAKILHTKKPLVYVDCFAGKGKFDDGNLGSPLIALNIFQNRLKQSGVQSENQFIDANFIELHYPESLLENLSPYFSNKTLKVSVQAGNYESKIHSILQDKSGYNLFLYIDPYGVKNLDFNFLCSLAGQKFYSIEFLLNFNSHGFLRMACKFLKRDLPNELNLDGLIEYDNEFSESPNKTEEMLNRVAGGNYWKDIVHSFYKGEYNFYSLEEKLTYEYCKRLRQSYLYVLNMPIRVKSGCSPKYRMIYATNHHDGAILMADNIWRREKKLHEIQFGGQQVLFSLDYGNKNFSEMLPNYLSTIHSLESLYKIMANFFTEYGVLCDSKEFEDIVRYLDNNGKLEIIRKPDKTKKGTPTKFYTEGKGKTVKLKWKI